MNKVVEEAMTNMIRRIEELEDKMARMSVPNSKGFYEPGKKIQSGPGIATPGQVKYIRILGGDPWPEMTKIEAGKEIDRLMVIKESGEKREIKPAEEYTPEPIGAEELKSMGLTEEDLM